MPQSLIPAVCDGTDPVRRVDPRRLAWAPIALIATLVATAQAAAQTQVIFSQDPKGKEGVVNELRLRPNIPRETFLHIKHTGPKTTVKVVLFAGNKPVPGASKVLELPAGKGILKPVVFGEAPPPKDGKPAPLPLAPLRGSLSIRLLDDKDMDIEDTDPARIEVAAPSEYVKVLLPVFDRETEDGKKNVLEVKLSIRPEAKFVGPPARVELVLSPERIPALVPGQRREGAYGGLLRPNTTLVLRAENLQFRKDAEERQGLFYLVIDGYPRAFTFMSSFNAEKGQATTQEVPNGVLRVVHPRFVKPGAKLPVVVEVDNLLSTQVCTLGMFRDKGLTPSSLEGQMLEFTGNRAATVLFNPKGPKGALVFDSRVADHAAEFDTKDLFGVRYLATGIRPEEAKENARAYVTVLDSKKVPEFGLRGRTKRIVEPVLMHEGSPEVTLDLDLPPPAKGKDRPLLVGAPLPVKATAIDPTGVTKAVFFLGKPLADGKIPPGAVQAEGEQAAAASDVWVAELPAPTLRGGLVTVSVQVENGVGEKTIRTIRVQLIDPKAGLGVVPAVPAKLATITGIVHEGSRPTPGVPVTLRDDKGALKAATKTNAAGVYKFEQVVPGAYVVSATRSASMTRGQALVSVPPGVVLVGNVDVKLTR